MPPTPTNLPAKTERTPRQQFGISVSTIAERELTALAGSEAGRAAAARVALAFRSAVAVAKDPDAFYACTPESVGAAMATSAFTQIMPGGPFPGCYLIPKRVNLAKRGQPDNFIWQLNWWISHRGIKALARRAGQGIEAIPYFPGDEVVIVRGKDWRVEVVEGDCPDRDSIDNLLGFVYYVTDLSTGMLLAARKVSRDAISKRRAASDTVDKQTGAAKFGPWRDWPMEMAEKTVIKYAAARGDLVFDDVGNSALSREAETIEATAEVVSVSAQPAPAHTPTRTQQRIAGDAPTEELPPPPEREYVNRNESANNEEEGA